ncbi:hypothetical protein AB0F24_30255 [Streptomyces platensis]|uniref:tetratricopeptide repeat protein n=1 Tax=Streptomyces platensis TaxID=58346 RepID=UPI0034109CD9
MIVAAGSPGGEDAFFADLHRLGDLYRTRLASSLPLRTLARAAGISSPTTVSEWLRGSRFPQHVEALTAAVASMQSTALRAGIEVPEEDRSLLDPAAWRDRHQEVAQHRAQVVSVGVRRERAAAAVASHDAAARIAALSDAPRALRKWRPQQLGVHPAIPGPTAIPGSLSAPADVFVLPPYVEREHDQELRACLDRTASGQDAAFVVVRGESCTGKTRTAYEAVRACLSGWHLAFPKDAESLLAILAADALSPRTILWLNEAQEFLSGPLGESAAVALRRRLEQAGPVIIIATLWPAHYRTLADRPENQGHDPHRQARALLAQAALFHVPDTFQNSALEAARAKDDSSLRTAICTSVGGAITQTLAAAPQLVDHYEQADGPPACYGKAVITAAMDARRLGHASPLPARLLEAAAPGYLTEAQRAAAPREWLPRALAYARTKVMGVAAALGDAANPDGMGPLPDVYRLADYLDHYARSLRRYSFPPVSFWLAVEQHAASPADLHGLAESARQRGRFRTAENFFSRAAADGHPEAWEELAYLSQDWPSLGDSEKLAWKAWEAGFPEPILNLALLYQQEGDHVEAERVSRAAADTGNPAALLALAQFPEYLESSEEAEQLANAAADLGEVEALTFLGRIRMRAGDVESADKFFQQALSVGDVSAAFELMQMWERAGAKEKAERAACQAADLGDYFGLAALAALRSGSGSREDAERLARSAADLVGAQFSGIWDAPWSVYQGRWFSLSVLAALAEEAERGSGERVYLEAAAEGDLYALTQLGHYRCALGDTSEAEKLYKKAAEFGHDRALVALVWIREKEGDMKGAEEICRTAVDAGHGAIGNLASILKKKDRQELADHLFIYGLDLDGSVAVKWQPRSTEPGWWDSLR